MRIGIIGCFGGNAPSNDGQSVKVNSLYNALSKKIDKNIAIDKVDTYYLRHNPFKLAIAYIKALFRDKKIIFLPAANGRKVLMPLMYINAKLFHKDIYHDCIGGKQVYELKSKPKYIRYWNSYKYNWLESKYVADSLAQLGVKNAEYLPNFKNLQAVNLNDLVKPSSYECFRFCTFCRVSDLKGIGDAIDAIIEINKKYGRKVASLDIYGSIQPGEEEWFEEQTKKFSDVCKYCGVIDAEKSVEALKDYYVLLFPTKCKTEGMPGTIIDAMFAGLPVIARHWDSCDQMITDGYNGVSYDFDKPELLTEKIEYAIQNPDMIWDMKKNCIEEASKYSEETVSSTIIEKMNLRTN